MDNNFAKIINVIDADDDNYEECQQIIKKILERQYKKMDMKKLLLSVVVLLFLTACNKRYTYVEIILEHQIFGGKSVTTKEEVKIRARNDTLAYIEAYEKYCISQAVYIGMKERYGMPELQDVPLGFKLFNSKGKDISKINFATKVEQEQLIEERAFRAGSEVFQR